MLVSLSKAQVAHLIAGKGNWTDISGIFPNVTGQVAYTYTDNKLKTHPQILFTFRQDSKAQVAPLAVLEVQACTAEVEFTSEFAAALNVFGVPNA